jgi:tight adherence protein B
LALECRRRIIGFSDYRLVPGFVTQKSTKKSDEERTAAIAVWLEQLRDTIAVSAGLEQAIVATAQVGPAAISPELQRLGARIAYQDTVLSLREFANEIDTSLGDFVVSALTIAIRHQARDLTSLLSHLAETAHEQHRASVRIWVGRARTRSSVRIISASVAVFIVGLVLLDREYLSPYGTAEGQIVLTGVLFLFVLAFAQLQKLSESQEDHRFVLGTRAYV